MSTSAAPTPEVSVIDHGFRAMNTNLHVLIMGGRAELAERAEASVRRCEQRWSRFLTDSELSQLNTASGHPVIVAPDTYRLVETAVDAFHQTGGVFDPTVLRCMIDAGYTRSFELIEAAEDTATDAVRAAPTPEGIEFFPAIHAVRLPPGVGLDLGGIAKGATADLVAGELMAAGVDGCCINVGGDVALRGAGPVDGGWHVDLDCPGTSERRAVHLAGGAVCTSTTLKRHWDRRGEHQHHLRRPVTGAPLAAGLVTAVIVGARATQVEVLTKVFLAAGPDRVDELAQRYDVTGVVITDDGELIELPGFERFQTAPTGERQSEVSP